MRRSLLALSLALLPLTTPQAHEHEDEHGSLGKHEHGAASLDVALDGNTLEIRLESPSMNLVGFEHAPANANDQARIAATRTLLAQPLQLFGLSAAADCTLSSSTLDSPLFAAPKHADESHEPEDEHGHSDVDASYRLHCEQPQALRTLDLTPLFERFPAIRTVAVQLIGHNGQQGAELSAEQARLSF